MATRTLNHHETSRVRGDDVLGFAVDASDGIGIGDTFDTPDGVRRILACRGCAPWPGFHFVDSQFESLAELYDAKEVTVYDAVTGKVIDKGAAATPPPAYHADEGERTIFRGDTMIGWWSVAGGRWFASKHAECWEANAFDMLVCTAAGVLAKLEAAARAVEVSK